MTIVIVIIAWTGAAGALGWLAGRGLGRLNLPAPAPKTPEPWCPRPRDGRFGIPLHEPGTCEACDYDRATGETAREDADRELTAQIERAEFRRLERETAALAGTLYGDPLAGLE